MDGFEIIAEEYNEVLNKNREAFIEEFIFEPKEEILQDVHWNMATMAVTYHDKVDICSKTICYSIYLWFDFYEKYKESE